MSRFPSVRPFPNKYVPTSHLSGAGGRRPGFPARPGEARSTPLPLPRPCQALFAGGRVFEEPELPLGLSLFVGPQVGAISFRAQVSRLLPIRGSCVFLGVNNVSFISLGGSRTPSYYSSGSTLPQGPVGRLASYYPHLLGTLCSRTAPSNGSRPFLTSPVRGGGPASGEVLSPLRFLSVSKIEAPAFRPSLTSLEIATLRASFSGVEVTGGFSNLSATGGSDYLPLLWRIVTDFGVRGSDRREPQD